MGQKWGERKWDSWRADALVEPGGVSGVAGDVSLEAQETIRFRRGAGDLRRAGAVWIERED